jgi:hypothetical protein
MKRKFMKFMLAMLVSTTLFTACNKDEAEANDEELITTMKLTFTPVGGGSALTYEFNDLDGPGGVAPTQDEIRLAPSKTYNVSLQLLNKTVTPAEDITVEVREESDAHRFYYESSPGSSITVSGLDNDVNGIPLGLTSTWATGVAATGSLKITLRHYAAVPPNKAAGDLVNSSKSATDIEVIFNTRVQ